MSFDRKDFDAVIKKRHSEANGRLLPMAQLLAGAAPVMDRLHRTEEWGRYATYLQGYVERYAKQKQVALAKLSDPSVTEDREIRKLRQDIFIADVTMDTLRFAIELPAAILQGGEEAENFIKEWEKKREASGNAQS